MVIHPLAMMDGLNAGHHVIGTEVSSADFLSTQTFHIILLRPLNVQNNFILNDSLTTAGVMTVSDILTPPQ
jgi:hypothetical protein